MHLFIDRSGILPVTLVLPSRMGASAQLCKLHRQIQGTRTIETHLASPEQGGKEDLLTVLQKARNLTEDRRTGWKKPYGKR